MMPAFNAAGMTVWARASSCRGTQAALVILMDGTIGASNAPTRKRSPSISGKAAVPNGVSKVAIDQPRHSNGISRPPKRSATYPPGNWMTVYPHRKAEKMMPNNASSQPNSRIMTGAAIEMLARSTWLISASTKISPTMR